MTIRQRLAVGLVLLSCLEQAGVCGPPRYTIRRVTRSTAPKIDGRLEDAAWESAASMGPFQFAWWKQGKKEQTDARMVWDDQNLYVAYRCRDAHVWAVFTKHDEPVYMDDCVELFTSPHVDHRENYFNIEMNVNGAILDRHHPEGPGKKPPTNWNSRGIRIATRVDGTLNDDSDVDRCWVLEVAIPFANFQAVARHTPPRNGDVWYLNLNRCGGMTNPQYSQWSKGGTKTPKFHVPRYFGRVKFSTRLVSVVKKTTSRSRRIFRQLGLAASAGRRVGVGDQAVVSQQRLRAGFTTPEVAEHVHRVSSASTGQHRVTKLPTGR
ncbi:MAG: hypothetical protein CMJ65_04570 [Planctomycetaceae bacterium]|nr:hypothetical protein [Planctomycetaceae bacterium]